MTREALRVYLMTPSKDMIDWVTNHRAGKLREYRGPCNSNTTDEYIK